MHFKFIQVFLKYRATYIKDNLFTIDSSVFDGFFKLLFCFHKVLVGYIQLTCFL